ncbi:recombinase family protein [Herbidospora mongoliensis]|uniref:recombinase family protein n=1 Tax=Herbidospora mongoliensis TaxID=688067 RepID=UPI000A00995B|nr:recombinase family protein [Herbidospora mongoliensis]
MTVQTLEATPEIIRLKVAMSTGQAMTINGVPGRWNAAGDRWTADNEIRTNAIILVRISDADPTDINGVARQVQDTIRHAKKRRARPRIILVENDTSAFKRKVIKLANGEKILRTDRPLFRLAIKLMATPKSGIRFFMAYDLDRTVRDPRDLEDLIDVVEQSRPRIIADSPTGSLKLANDSDITMARVMCAFMNKSSRDTRRRVSRDKLMVAEEGRSTGGPRPFGWEVDRTTYRASEAHVIDWAAHAALGPVTLSEIVREAKRQGVKTATGKDFTTQTMKAMILRPRNAGLITFRTRIPAAEEPARFDDAGYDDEEFDQSVPVDAEEQEDDEEEAPGKWPTPDDVVGKYPFDPIIEPEDYWALMAKLTDPDRRTNFVGNQPSRLGSNIYDCPCGAQMRADTRRDKRLDHATGEKTRIVEYPVYRCLISGKGHVACLADETDALVAQTIKEIIRISDPAELLPVQDTHVDVAALHAELARHRARLLEIADEREADLITKEQMREMTRKRQEKITTVQAQLDKVRDDSHPITKLIGAADIDEAWEGLFLGEQRAVLRRLLIVTLLPVGRGRRLPVRDRIDIRRKPAA